MLSEFFLIDLVALLFFVFAWFGYSFFANYFYAKEGNLLNIMHAHRLEWMRQMAKREDRIADTRVIGMLAQSVTFFASTSIIIVAALVPLIGYSEKIVLILEKIPFVVETNLIIWLSKVLLLLTIFVYSFFKYTWSLRQYNYAAIVCTATPLFKVGDNSDELRRYSERNAKILTNAAKHFSMGLRAYYFGLSILGWFIHPVVFMMITSIVLIVVYRREFMSRALEMLKM